MNSIPDSIDQAIATRFPSADEPEHVFDQNLPLETRISNRLLASDHFGLGELMDIPPQKCLDFCREMRAFASSIGEQIKIFPHHAEELRAKLEKARKSILRRIYEEGKRHD